MTATLAALERYERDALYFEQHREELLHRYGELWTAYLREFGITGPGPGSLGAGELLAFARALGRQEGVRSVVVEGRTRTTGAAPGRSPRSVTVKVP